MVQGVPVLFVVDTGSERTIISQKVFNKITDKPNLAHNGGLVHAGGSRLTDFGNVY